jgi:predicted nucleotidyltransferase
MKKTKNFVSALQRNSCEDCHYCKKIGNNSNTQKTNVCTKLDEPFNVLLDDVCDEHLKAMPLHLEITMNYFNIPKKQFDINKIINVYFYGSYNYGTNNEESDMDYIIVYDQDINISDTIKATAGNTELNATLISPEYFQKLIDEHDISILESLNIQQNYKFEREYFSYNINLTKLRKSISSISSNSWVKCKKKLAQGDDNIGYKSLFHSLRILDFGIQLAKHNKIVSFAKPDSKSLKYKTFDELLNEIKTQKNWDEIYKKYKEIYNSLRTEFKLLAPK